MLHTQTHTHTHTQTCTHTRTYALGKHAGEYLCTCNEMLQQTSVCFTMYMQNNTCKLEGHTYLQLSWDKMILFQDITNHMDQQSMSSAWANLEHRDSHK